MRDKNKIMLKRKARVRGHLVRHLTRPRLVVYRSNEHIYAQIIDHQTGNSVTASSDLTFKGKATKIEKATKVGEQIAKQALAKKITKITLDRGPYKYHGRVKALAESARKAGLEF